MGAKRTVAEQDDFPIPTLKYVYGLLLLIALIQIAFAVGSDGSLGFMDKISGKDNVLAGQGLLIAMAAMSCAFIFVTYLDIEAFEEKKGRFEYIRRPGPVVEAFELCIRFLLLFLITVKVWKPDTYREALGAQAALSCALLIWSVVISRFCRAHWEWRSVFLLLIAGISFWGWRISGDREREADLGVWMIVILTMLSVVFGLLAARRGVELIGPWTSRNLGWVRTLAENWLNGAGLLGDEPVAHARPLVESGKELQRAAPSVETETTAPKD